MHDGRVMRCKHNVKIMASPMSWCMETISEFADTFEQYIQLSPMDKGTHVGRTMASIKKIDPGKKLSFV